MLWIALFLGTAVSFLFSAREPQAVGGGVELQLREGVWSQGVYRDGKRLGGIVHRTARAEAGWVLTDRFFADRRDVPAGARPDPLGEIRLVLHRDLSLSEVDMRADLSRLLGMAALGQEAALLRGTGLGAVRIKGRCNALTGECAVTGEIASRKISFSLGTGRGPVLPSVVFPLLARGVLGREVELTIFDPLSLERRSMIYRLLGHQDLRLASQPDRPVRALAVQQEMGSMRAELWLDDEGRVLKERLPMGVTIEHESWGAR